MTGSGSKGRIGVVARGLAVAALLLVEVVALQIHDGAYRSEPGGHSDEAAHIVTGLLALDYLRQGLGERPMEFARDFYAHYPKVALGHWPPGFYVLQAAWYLPLGASRNSAILLEAALTTLLALVLYRTVRRVHGTVPALAAAAILPALPVLRWSSARVMADVPTALLATLALVALDRWLAAEGRRIRPALFFAALAAAAALTKGNALCLAAAPVLAAAIAGGRRLLARPAPWAMAAGFAAIVGPWYLATADLARDGLPAWQASRTFLLGLAAGPAVAMAWGATVPVLAAALAGLAGKGRRAISRPVLVAAFSAFAAFHVATAKDHFEARYFVLILPLVLVAAAAGIETFARSWARRAGSPRSRPVRSAVLWGVLGALAIGPSFATVERKAFGGFEEAWEDIRAAAGTEPPVVVIASDPIGEGMLVAAAALADRRPGAWVLRGSKVLSTCNWAGGEYLSTFSTPREVEGYLRRSGIGYAVVDRSVSAESRRAHHALLEEALEGNPRWERIGVRDALRKGIVHEGAIGIYRYRGDPAEGSCRSEVRRGAGEADVPEPSAR